VMGIEIDSSGSFSGSIRTRSSFFGLAARNLVSRRLDSSASWESAAVGGTASWISASMMAMLVSPLPPGAYRTNAANATDEASESMGIRRKFIQLNVL